MFLILLIVEYHPGDQFFSFYDMLGTVNTAQSDSIYKVQYYEHTIDPQKPTSNISSSSSSSTLTSSAKSTSTSSDYVEQWHGNGMLVFTTQDGTSILAYTHRAASEGVLLRNPYVYTARAGGGSIVQRFGTPQYGQLGDAEARGGRTNGAGDHASATYHAFGVPQDTPVWTGGVHNLFYTRASPTSTNQLQGHDS